MTSSRKYRLLVKRSIFIIFLFRLGCAIPVPFLDLSEGLIGNNTDTFLNYLTMLTGDDKAIAQSVAEAYHGTLRVWNDSGAVFEFIVDK